MWCMQASFGSMKPKLVAERRLKLQAFLQGVVRIAEETEGTPLQQETSKGALLLTLPFLGESTSSLEPIGQFEDEWVHVP